MQTFLNYVFLKLQVCQLSLDNLTNRLRQKTKGCECKQYQV